VSFQRRGGVRPDSDQTEASDEVEKFPRASRGIDNWPGSHIGARTYAKPPAKVLLAGGDFALLWLKASLAPELVIDVWSRNRILRHVRLETGAILRYIRPSNAGVSRRLNGIGGPPERREVCADLAVIPRTEFPRHFVIDSE
jgi:hypothetical protein